MRELFLVSCVSQKRDFATAARDLYTSTWFVKARAWVDGHGATWRILSAEHGLLAPDTQIEPYNRTLNTMQIAERRQWAARVGRQMEAADIRTERIVVLAGKRYREFLMPLLKGRAEQVLVPMAGLGIGQQLAWLKERSR